MSATGQANSGAFVTTVNQSVLSLFRQYGTARLADYLGLAEDLRWDPAAAIWLHDEYRNEIDRIVNWAGLCETLVRNGDIEKSIEEAIAQTAHALKTEADIAFTKAAIRHGNAPREDKSMPTTSDRGSRDCFISHAGEDRDQVARPLAEELTERQRSVWFSGFELTIGDSLRKKIDEGLRICRYGVVVLSPNFFDKPWPEAELDALAARAMNERRKVILPVWHCVTKDDVARYSPMLAGVLAANTDRGLPHVADEIIRALGAGTKEAIEVPRLATRPVPNQNAKNELLPLIYEIRLVVASLSVQHANAEQIRNVTLWLDSDLDRLQTLAASFGLKPAALAAEGHRHLRVLGELARTVQQTPRMVGVQWDRFDWSRWSESIQGAERALSSLATAIEPNWRSMI